MWIRSQSRKSLVYCKDIYLAGNEIREGHGSSDTYTELGIYESEERAIQILDVLHTGLINGVKESLVFQMPER